MADVIIIGDGPGGLSAALFTAKKDMPTTVFGTNDTPMHAAMLYNYLGIEEMTGTDFQNLARAQVEKLGAAIHDKKITAVAQADDGFTVTDETGDQHTAKYLIIAAGHKPEFAAALGLELNEKGTLDADRDGRTAVENLYAVGWSVRPDKIQAIISAGDGAAAALDILSKEAGKDIHDFDVVE